MLWLVHLLVPLLKIDQYPPAHLRIPPSSTVIYRNLLVIKIALGMLPKSGLADVPVTEQNLTQINLPLLGWHASIMPVLIVVGIYF
jgi:hypothetical protein